MQPDNNNTKINSAAYTAGPNGKAVLKHAHTAAMPLIVLMGEDAITQPAAGNC